MRLLRSAVLRVYSEVEAEGPAGAEDPPPEELLAEIAGDSASHPGVQGVALDALSEIYRLDFAQRAEKFSRFRDYRLWQARLEKLCREAIVSGMYTADSAFLEDKYGVPLPLV
ncbi:uncharacterized protein LOC108088563 [Drosophila ficusphila]|uniref:uncharacterized protein LOC108088563 n=1 Tax=Drosophila ficusphila TaxID=30025 RepID=UPI0007E74C7F|nr:uncharacterized protein LOC108088563 [Drosophila ficusphila]